MLSSLILLLFIFNSKSKFIIKYENDLSVFFYGVDKVKNPSWQNLIFLFIIIYCVDIFFKKNITKNKSIFFPKSTEKNKPFGLFPSAYEEKLVIFNNKHNRWIKNQIKLNFLFMLSTTIFFLLFFFR